MKKRSLFLLMMAASAFAQSGVVPTPAPRPRLTDELRRKAGDETSGQVSNVVATAPTSEQDTMTREPFVIFGIPVAPSTAPGIEPADHPFSWKDGGTILKNVGPTFTTEVKFQYNPFLYWPTDEKIDLLKIAW